MDALDENSGAWRRGGVHHGLLALLTLALGCGDPSVTAPPDSPSSARPIWAGVMAEHWLPGPHHHDRASEDRSELEAGCRSCHAEIAKEWASSQHANSWSSAAFQAAFTVEPLRFCQSCHAPEVSPEDEVADWAADIGIGCVTCHVEPGTERIWSASRDASAPESAPHPINRAPAFAGPQACAGCHEFEFPDAAVRERPLLMQSTVREHASSAYADRSCADCHMPTIAGRRSHSFLGAYDQEMLARSLIITARREGDRVTLSLAPGEVGHAVPSGDLLRRLELRVELITADGSRQALGRRWLGRRFGPIQQHDGLTLRGELEDTRVGPEGVVVEFAVPASARNRTLRWTVTHQRVAHATFDPSRAVIEGQLEIASGELPDLAP